MWAPRNPSLLLCMLGLAVLSVISAQSVAHYKPHDPPSGALSKFNKETMNYEPVTYDKSYTYYRLRINLNESFYDFYQPDPKSPSLYMMVASGDVLDNSTATKVGAFDMQGVTTMVDANQKLQYMATMVVELGPAGNDAIFVAAGLERAKINQDIVDFDMAVTGGTGRYKGATGEVFFTGTATTTPGNLYTAEVIVPKFKRFW